MKSSINTSFAEGNVLDVVTCMQCLSEKYFASSRIESSGAYKRTLVAGKEELNFEDLQESCNQFYLAFAYILRSHEIASHVTSSSVRV